MSEFNHSVQKSLNNMPANFLHRVMKPTIKTSSNGEITILNEHINYDFYINSDGEIVRRTKKLDPKERKSLDLISLHEAGTIYDPNINEMIIGCDSKDKIWLSNEATDFFEEKKCKIKLLPLDEAIVYWNRYEGHAIGLFHIPQK